MKRFLTIQRHDAKRAGLHWDLRISHEDGPSDQLSWVLPKVRLPNVNETCLAIQVEDHPWSYRRFEGTIESGYGEGTVELLYAGDIEVTRWETNAISFVYQGRGFALRKTGDKWFIIGKKR